MASVVGKRVNGRTYYYLVSSGRVGGKPRVVSQRYLGSADDIAAAFDGGGSEPSRTWQLSFGTVAAAWQAVTDLDVVRTVDDVVGRGRARVSVGQYVGLAVLHRIAAPGAPLDLAGWWPTTAAERFVRPRVDRAALEHRRVWRALGRITPEHIDEIQRALAPKLLDGFGADAPVLALDVPDFAVLQESSEVAGMAYLATLDGAVPLLSRLYRPDVPFSSVLGSLADRYASLTNGTVTVVAGAGQRAQADLGSRLGLPFVGPLVPGDHPELVRTSISRMKSVDGIPGVAYTERHAELGGVDQRVILVVSESLRTAQERELRRNLSHATRRLDDLAAVVASDPPGQSRDKLLAEIARIAYFRWSERVLSTRLDGSERSRFRLRWSVDEAALDRLRDELLGKQLLVTDREDWSASQVITAYRARYRLESTVRHLDSPLLPTASLAAHALISVLATTVTHLLRRQAQRVGLDLSVRDLLDQLAGIEETVLRYPSTGGRPRTRRLLTDLDPTRQLLFDRFELSRCAPERRAPADRPGR